MQNKCLKDSSVLEGLAETQQSQYKPDVSQQVLGGETCSLRVWACSGGTASYNTDTVTTKKGGRRLSKSLPTEGLMRLSVTHHDHSFFSTSTGPRWDTQHLVCVKYIFFQNTAESRAPETLKLFHQGKQDKVCDDFASKIWSILRLTMILELLWPPQNQNIEAKFNPG